MRLTPTSLDISKIPPKLHSFLDGAKLYEISSPHSVKVFFVDKDNGYFLKIGPKQYLKREHRQSRYFYDKGLAAKIVLYLYDYEYAYFMTEKVKGEDCTAQKYLENPKQLSGALGEYLAELHTEDYSDYKKPKYFPVNHTKRSIFNIESNYLTQRYNMDNFGDNKKFLAPFVAYNFFNANKNLLKTDTLLHGDYCLPNIILDNWQLSAFVDLDSGGVGDRHFDLYYGQWSLEYNLKTSKYNSRFLDAYGRDKIDDKMFRLIEVCDLFL